MNKGVLFAAVLACSSNCLSAQTRLSLYESFSGEHCVSCALANPGVQSLTAGNSSKVLHITYPTPIPAAGPLSSTYPSIANSRIGYYSIASAPQGRLNGTGMGSGTSQSITGHVSNLTQGDIDAAAGATAPLNISVSHAWSVTGDSVLIQVSINAPAAYAPSGASLKLRLALVEQLNYSVAPGINAEESFPNTVRDMYPSPAGTTISNSWTLGQSASFTIVAKPARYVDKRHANIIAWVQNDADKSIVQAATSIPVTLANDAATLGVLPVGRLQCVVSSANVNSGALLHNAGSSTLNSARIYYRTDASSVSTFVNWTGSLQPNATTLVPLGGVGIAGGNHYILDSVALPNGVLDINAGNNTGTGNVSVYNTVAGSLPVVTGFEGPNGVLPSGWILYDADSNGRNFSVSKNLFGGPAGYAGSSWFLLHNNFYVPSGEVNYAILPAANLPAGGSVLRFAYAHAPYSTESDKLEVVYSNNCGASWTPVWSEAGPTLSTAPASTDFFVPTASQWVTRTVLLNGLNSNTMIAFRATSDYGNSLYIDNVRLEVNNGVEGISVISHASLYPSPASEETSLELYLHKASRIQIAIVDGTGRVVKPISDGMIAAGTHRTYISTTQLSSGLYYVRINSEAGSILKKLTVVH